MPTRTVLTDMALRKLAAPETGQREVWDSKIAGFGVRVSQAGTKSYVLMCRVNGRQRRMTLGRYPDLSLSDARTKAVRALADVAGGQDPTRTPGTTAGEGASYEPSTMNRFAPVVEKFIDMHCNRKNRPSTAAETARLLRTEFVGLWRNRPLEDIRKIDVLRALDAMVDRGTPSAANHAFAAVRRLFSWCIERGLLEMSPCAGIKMPSKSVSRDRVLSEDELQAVWKASIAIGYPMGTMAQLLALTGQRRGEVAKMRWVDINAEERTWTIPADVAKSNRTHLVPLTPLALELIETAPRFDDVYVFPARGKPQQPFVGFSKAKRRIDVEADLIGWTFHDLRRTAATGMARLGTQPHVVERILNHASGTFAGVAGVYNRFGYLPEMREALEKWEKYIFSLQKSQSN